MICKPLIISSSLSRLCRASTPDSFDDDGIVTAVESRGKIEQLPTMNEDQRIDAALCDEPGGNNRLAEGRRRGQHADLLPVSGCNITLVVILFANGDQADGNVLVESAQAAQGLDATGDGPKTGGVATVPVLAGARTPAVDEAPSFKVPTAL